MATLDSVFLQNIINDPRNAGERLIYADILDERGDPRGEFIRVQLALEAQWGNAAPRISREKRAVLENRQQELLELYREVWANNIPELLWHGHYGSSCAYFAGGFLDNFNIIDESRAAVLFSNMREICLNNPITGMRFYPSNDYEFSLLTINNDHLRQIAEMAPNLRSLELHGNQEIGPLTVDDDGINAYVSQLLSLEHLGIFHTEITSAGLAAIGKMPCLRSLSFLDNGRFGAAGYAAISAKGSLESLDIRGNTQFLSHIGNMASLRNLELFGHHITDSELDSISPMNLKSLLFTSMRQVSDAGFSHLGRIAGLEHLHIWNWAENDRGIRQAACENIGKLERLKTLNIRALDAAGINCFGNLKKLEALELTYDPPMEEKEKMREIATRFILEGNWPKIVDCGYSNFMNESSYILTGDEIAALHAERESREFRGGTSAFINRVDNTFKSSPGRF